jgi:Methyltransferase domain
MNVRAQANRISAVRSDMAGILRQLARIRSEARRHTPRPPDQGIVLDVGGGQAGHPRADVIVDKYVADNFERPHEAEMDLSRPLVVADGHHLPFADKTFAYVIALHVLEHATDPASFAGELSRVADAGFVQLPSRESELTFGWPYHPWLIDRDGDVLVFNSREGRHAPLGDTFHRSYAENPLVRLWWAAERSRWHHSIEWKGQLHVEVHGESAADATAALDVERTLVTLETIARRGALKPLPQTLVAALRCPLDGGRLRSLDARLECASCGRAFPLVGGTTPVLVEEAAA